MKKLESFTAKFMDYTFATLVLLGLAIMLVGAGHLTSLLILKII